MIVDKDGKRVFIDSNNREFIIEKREYPYNEDYYETRGVGTKARSDKHCEFCGDTIIKGVPHSTHHFYPEFYSYTTHKECSEAFFESLCENYEEAEKLFDI